MGRVFESRKTQYLPECRRARHILVKVPEAAGEDEKAAAKRKVETALERVKAGEDFAKVAKQVSDDGSASEGGNLGCFQQGRMVKPFEDAAFGLESGRDLAIVETQFGYHIIKLDAVYKDPRPKRKAAARRPGRS